MIAIDTLSSWAFRDDRLKGNGDGCGAYRALRLCRAPHCVSSSTLVSICGYPPPNALAGGTAEWDGEDVGMVMGGAYADDWLHHLCSNPSFTSAIFQSLVLAVI